MGGPLVLTAMGTFPDRMAEERQFMAPNLANDRPDSPHLLAPRCAGVYVASPRSTHGYSRGRPIASRPLWKPPAPISRWKCIPECSTALPPAATRCMIVARQSAIGKHPGLFGETLS